MCIVIYKKSGVAMPNRDVMKICFENNPDGAGYMYKAGDRIMIKKGYMVFDDFYNAISRENFGIDDEVGIHFRIGTGGGNIPANTHPFPISNDIKNLQSLQCKAKKAIMHNGIIGRPEGDLSDTMVYVRDILSGLMPYIKYKKILKAIESTTQGSRLLIFDQDAVYLTGDWIDDHGLMYSNSGYIEKDYSAWDNIKWDWKEDKAEYKNLFWCDWKDDAETYYCSTCDCEFLAHETLLYGVCPACKGELLSW
jgi:hypothetical protein